MFEILKVQVYKRTMVNHYQDPGNVLSHQKPRKLASHYPYRQTRWCDPASIKTLEL